MLLQALVGTSASDVIHVFDLKLVIAANSLFAPLATEDVPPCADHARVALPEPPARVLQWLSENYAHEAEVDAQGNVRAAFVYLRDESPLLFEAGAHRHKGSHRAFILACNTFDCDAARFVLLVSRCMLCRFR